MKAYKCDRCGKLFDEYRGQGTCEYYSITRNPNFKTDVLDLCPRCNEELQNWVKKVKSENKDVGRGMTMEERDVLDNIRNEIMQLDYDLLYRNEVLQIIDKYKAESGGSCEPMTKTLGIELRHNPSELVELLEEQYKSGEISPIVISESLITLFRMLGEKRIVESEGQE